MYMFIFVEIFLCGDNEVFERVGRNGGKVLERGCRVYIEVLEGICGGCCFVNVRVSLLWVVGEWVG